MADLTYRVWVFNRLFHDDYESGGRAIDQIFFDYPCSVNSRDLTQQEWDDFQHGFRYMRNPNGHFHVLYLMLCDGQLADDDMSSCVDVIDKSITKGREQREKEIKKQEIAAKKRREAREKAQSKQAEKEKQLLRKLLEKHGSTT